MILWPSGLSVYCYSLVRRGVGEDFAGGTSVCVVGVSFHSSSCTNVYVYFHCPDVFNVRTESFFISTLLYKQNSRGKTILGRGSLKYL